MAKAFRRAEAAPSLLKTLWHMCVVLVSGAKPLVYQLRESLDEQLDLYARVIEKRLIILALCGFALFLSVFSLGLGFIFVAIDYGGFPRGIVFLCGGILGLGAFGFLVRLIK